MFIFVFPKCPQVLKILHCFLSHSQIEHYLDRSRLCSEVEPEADLYMSTDAAVDNSGGIIGWGQRYRVFEDLLKAVREGDDIAVQQLVEAAEFKRRCSFRIMQDLFFSTFMTGFVLSGQRIPLRVFQRLFSTQCLRRFSHELKCFPLPKACFSTPGRASILLVVFQTGVVLSCDVSHVIDTILELQEAISKGYLRLDWKLNKPKSEMSVCEARVFTEREKEFRKFPVSEGKYYLDHIEDVRIEDFLLDLNPSCSPLCQELGGEVLDNLNSLQSRCVRVIRRQLLLEGNKEFPEIEKALRETVKVPPRLVSKLLGCWTGLPSCEKAATTYNYIR